MFVLARGALTVSVSDTICTCGVIPERDAFGSALPCMRCYFGAPDYVLRCLRSTNPCGTDTVQMGEACPCVPCRQWKAAFKTGIEAAAIVIASKADAYPTDIFPEDGTSQDANSAAMGRHCARVWTESLRRYKETGEP